MYLTGHTNPFIWHWMTYRSAHLCFEGLLVSKVGFTGLLLYHLDKGFTLQHPSSRRLGWFQWDPEIQWNFNACTVTPQTIELAAWSHSNQQKVRKVKPNANTRIYYVFERLVHQNPAKFFCQKLLNKNIPAIQTCFLIPQITENIEQWPKIVSNGGPKIFQGSMKIHPGTL